LFSVPRAGIDLSAGLSADLSAEAAGDLFAEAGGDLSAEAGGDLSAEAGGDLSAEAGGEGGRRKAEGRNCTFLTDPRILGRAPAIPYLL
jgi:hypothetical protein